MHRRSWLDSECSGLGSGQWHGVSKIIDRLTTDTRRGLITRKLLRTQKAIIKAMSVSLLIQKAGLAWSQWLLSGQRQLMRPCWRMANSSGESGLWTTAAWAVGRLGSEASSRRWRCSGSYWNMRRWIHITFIIIHALRILQGYLQQLQVIFNDTLHPPHTI